MVWIRLNQLPELQKTGPRWSSLVPSISGSVLDQLWTTVACFTGKKNGLNQTWEQPTLCVYITQSLVHLTIHMVLQEVHEVQVSNLKLYFHSKLYFLSILNFCESFFPEETHKKNAFDKALDFFPWCFTLLANLHPSARGPRDCKNNTGWVFFPKELTTAPPPPNNKKNIAFFVLLPIKSNRAPGFRNNG